LTTLYVVGYLSLGVEGGGANLYHWYRDNDAANPDTAWARE
jgi:hypothetical protein